MSEREGKKLRGIPERIYCSMYPKPKTFYQSAKDICYINNLDDRKGKRKLMSLASQYSNRYKRTLLKGGYIKKIPSESKNPRAKYVYLSTSKGLMEHVLEISDVFRFRYIEEQNKMRKVLESNEFRDLLLLSEIDFEMKYIMNQLNHIIFLTRLLENWTNQRAKLNINHVKALMEGFTTTSMDYLLFNLSGNGKEMIEKQLEINKLMVKLTWDFLKVDQGMRNMILQTDNGRYYMAQFTTYERYEGIKEHVLDTK